MNFIKSDLIKKYSKEYVYVPYGDEWKKVSVCNERGFLNVDLELYYLLKYSPYFSPRKYFWDWLISAQAGIQLKENRTIETMEDLIKSLDKYVDFFEFDVKNFIVIKKDDFKRLLEDEGFRVNVLRMDNIILRKSIGENRPVSVVISLLIWCRTKYKGEDVYVVSLYIPGFFSYEVIEKNLIMHDGRVVCDCDIISGFLYRGINYANIYMERIKMREMARERMKFLRRKR